MTPIRAKICRVARQVPVISFALWRALDRPFDVSVARSLLVEFGFEALRGPRFIVIGIAPWTRLSRAAAGAGAAALEWPVRMVLTNPAAILTNEAFHGLRPRAGAFSLDQSYHLGPLYSIKRMYNVAPIEHSKQTFHRSLCVPAVFPQDALGVLNCANDGILVGIVHDGTQLHESGNQDWRRIFVPVSRCGFMSRRLSLPVARSVLHLHSIPAPHWQPNFSSPSTRSKWFSQTQPMPKQIGQFLSYRRSGLRFNNRGLYRPAVPP